MKLTEDIIKQLQQLDNKFATIFADLKQSSADELEALHKYAKISMIGSSTRIENALLTDVEVSWIDTILTENGNKGEFDHNRNLIEKKLSKDRERSIEEVAGCRSMLSLIYSTHYDFTPLKENDLRALHYELMSPYKKAVIYAGKYKTQSNFVIERDKMTGESRVVFETASPGPITSVAMRDLMEWYNEAAKLSPWPVSIASELVYRFLAIHPFQDGNGRLARSMFLLSLLSSNSDIISFVAKYIAIDRHIEINKEEYYFVLNRCSDGKFHENISKYKIEYFIKFMIKVLNQSLEGIAICKKRYRAELDLPVASHEVLNCFRDHPEIRLTTGKLIEETSLPRRTVVFSLNKLLDAHIIQKYGHGPATKYQLVF